MRRIMSRKSYSERFRGKFDMGWDKFREIDRRPQARKSFLRRLGLGSLIRRSSGPSRSRAISAALAAAAPFSFAADAPKTKEECLKQKEQTASRKLDLAIET
jgi:hypothetical protein